MPELDSHADQAEEPTPLEKAGLAMTACRELLAQIDERLAGETGDRRHRTVDESDRLTDLIRAVSINLDFAGLEVAERQAVALESIAETLSSVTGAHHQQLCLRVRTQW